MFITKRKSQSEKAAYTVGFYLTLRKRRDCGDSKRVCGCQRVGEGRAHVGSAGKLFCTFHSGYVSYTFTQTRKVCITKCERGQTTARPTVTYPRRFTNYNQGTLVGCGRRSIFLLILNCSEKNSVCFKNLTTLLPVSVTQQLHSQFELKCTESRSSDTYTPVCIALFTTAKRQTQSQCALTGGCAPPESKTRGTGGLEANKKKTLHPGNERLAKTQTKPPEVLVGTRSRVTHAQAPATRADAGNTHCRRREPV